MLVTQLLGMAAAGALMLVPLPVQGATPPSVKLLSPIASSAIAHQLPKSPSLGHQLGIVEQGSDRSKGNRQGNSHVRADVIVYGRPECGLTRNMQRDLHARAIPYEFKNIDHRGVAQEMWALLSGASSNVRRSVRLPVVRVGRQVLVNATIADVERVYWR